MQATRRPLSLPYRLGKDPGIRHAMLRRAPNARLDRQPAELYRAAGASLRDDWHLDAVAVNATTSYPGLHKVRRRVSLASQRLAEAAQDILNGKYRVITSSPGQLLEYNKLRPMVIQLAG
ncbi:hypothetical protein FRC12_011986 [Ceratobasidium sp. 428]|nr:hypothetical protein FRC12_011986 [Ceratobasidium sp. 428]